MSERTHLTTLPSGVRVATVEMPHMKSVSIGFWTGVGSRHEVEKHGGVAHFIEHMLFKGTASRTSEEISRQIERIGASIDAFTTEDHTGYQVKGPAEELDTLLDVLVDFYQHPKFDSEDLENERGVIHEEIAMVHDQPAQWLEDLTSEAAWPDHPLGRPITGTSESLDRLDRETVMAFYRENYIASQTVVTVAGNVTHEQVIARLGRDLVDLPAAPLVEPLSAPDCRSGFSFAARDDLEQAHLAIGFHAFSRHDDERYAQKMLNVLLGENMSSRLFQELREREGLCYEVQSDIMSFEDTGLLHIYVALEPKEAPRALASLKRVLAEFVEKPPTIQELNDAKTYIIGQGRIALENTASQMMWAGECLLSFNRLIDPESIERRLAKVTPEDVQALAKVIFDGNGNRLVTAAVAPSALESSLREWHESWTQPG